jgi:hypothetical protein
VQTPWNSLAISLHFPSCLFYSQNIFYLLSRQLEAINSSPASIHFNSEEKSNISETCSVSCHQRMTMTQEVTEKLTLTPTCDAREECITPVILHTAGDLMYNYCYSLHSGLRLTTTFCSYCSLSSFVCTVIEPSRVKPASLLHTVTASVFLCSYVTFLPPSIHSSPLTTTFTRH